ncbi:hypothetical protein E2C01_055679 [Portunus trituberculatus]|uniref:Uncharacterized protein n=1 Tax=Portunus trituberculatus TaxID=210409 RepID=A0A5B7GW78_PORTR|nr:hypothetical protein [Portunus trituberculatus]
MVVVCGAWDEVTEAECGEMCSDVFRACRMTRNLFAVVSVISDLKQIQTSECDSQQLYGIRRYQQQSLPLFTLTS